MLKKNLSIALILSMILSLLGSSSVWASAPVVVDGDDGSITVNQWRYDKTFTAANTVEELKDDGFTFNYTPTLTSSGLQIPHKSVTVTYGPNGKSISGDYYFETHIQREMNYYTFDFNNSADGYYRIEYGRIHNNSVYTKPWVRLCKYDATTKKTHILVDHAKTSIQAGIIRTYKGTVKTLEDGSVDINIGIYNGTTLEYTLAYTDTATDTVAVTTTTPVVDENGDPVYEEDGTTQKIESVTENVDTGTPLTTGKFSLQFNSTGEDTYIKYLKVYSLGEVIEGTPVTYSETVIDKTFSSTDTLDSIKTEGFTTSSSNGVTTTFADNYISFSGKTNTLIYTNADAINGTYAFNTKMKRSGNNYTSVYFNYKSSNNYYVLEGNTYPTAAADKKLRLKKVLNGKTYELKSKVITYAQGGGNTDLTVDVSVTQNEDGSLDIYTKWYANKNTIEYTWTDSDTDTVNVTTTMTNDTGEEVETTTAENTGAPITSGVIRLYQSYAASKVYSFKLTKYETVIEGGSDGIPVFEGKFSNDSGAINSISKDTIYFEYPTAMFGNYNVIATLYEDYKMTGIKVIKPTDLYLGKVALFDTTNSTAEDIKIRVYFFDGRDNLKIVADEVYELN